MKCIMPMCHEKCGLMAVAQVQVSMVMAVGEGMGSGLAGFMVHELTGTACYGKCVGMEDAVQR